MIAAPRHSGKAAVLAIALGLAAPTASAANPDGFLAQVQGPFNAVRGWVVGLFGGEAGGGHGGKAAGGHGAPHWAYEGPEGAANWGRLAKEFAVCGTGQQQSPINLAGVINAQVDDVAVDWKPVPVNALNNGHTIQVNVPAGSTLALDGKSYNLKQFHFHHPSEHTVNGLAYPMEAHFVHMAPDGKSAVVLGVFIEPGAENPTLQQVWNIMPSAAGTAEAAGTLDTSALLPSERQLYTYSGSLTTPPCTEIIHWIVYRTPIKASPAQIQAFRKLFENNARPVQALFRRKVLANF